jgi:hypothetical protein
MAIRNTRLILKNSDIVNRPLPSSLLKGEAIVNTADGIVLFSGVTTSTAEWTPAGTGTTANFFEVGSNLYDLKIRNQITSYNNLTNLSGKFLSGTTNGFVLADIADIANTSDSYVTGATWSPNTLTLKHNLNRPDVTVTINDFNNVSLYGTTNVNGDLTVTGTTTLNGPAYYNNTASVSNEIVNYGLLTAFSQTNDVYVTGNTLTAANDNTATQSAQLEYHGTPIGGPYFIDTQNTYTTGGTWNSGSTSIDFTRNDGVTYSVSLSNIDINDTYVTGGTVTSGGTLDLFRNDGVTVSVPKVTYWTSGSTGNFAIKAINNSGLDSTGDRAVSWGNQTLASGNDSTAWGYQTSATTIGSTSFGNRTLASAVYSTASGYYTIALGNFSHAEGRYTTASGEGSHSEGQVTTANGLYSHAEGSGSIASGISSHAEGEQTIASGQYSHAEGYQTSATTQNSHSEGYRTLSSGQYSHAEGRLTTSSGYYTHSEGVQTLTSGYGSHAEGGGTTASGYYSHAEGENTTAIGSGSHAEGGGTTASGTYSHAEGNLTTALGGASHAEGYSTTASGYYSHAEGKVTIASGYASHAEGDTTTASGYASHAEGYWASATTNSSHAEGYLTLASGNGSHAEGYQTTASGYVSHSQGSGTTASGIASFASGVKSIAQSDYSFIHSENSVVNGQRSVVLGGQNITGSTNDTVYVPYLNLNLTPTLNNSNTQILSRNTGTGQVEYTTLSAFTSLDTFVTGFTYNPNNNTFTISQNQGQPNLTASIGTVSGLTISNLTAGRVVYVGSSGLLTDESNFTYNESTDTLGVNNIESSGDVTIQGNLTVFGQSISAFTNNLYVEDPNITLNYNPTGNTTVTSVNAGFTVQDGNGTNGGSVNFDIVRMQNLTGLTSTEIPSVAEYTGLTGFANRGWITQLNDIVIRSTDVTDGGSAGDITGVRVLAEWDILCGGQY